LSSYKYKVDIETLKEIYMSHTGRNVYDDLGNVDFDKATLFVTAEDEQESIAIRKGLTDVRMWTLESVED
jgi:hypothetical protein